MEFNFSKQKLTGREKNCERFFEILPGATSWSILIGLTALSLLKPLWAAVFIITFDLYWLLRLLYTTIFLILSYWILAIEKNTDWLKRIQSLEGKSTVEKPPALSAKGFRLRRYLSFTMYQKELQILKNSPNPPPRASDIYHLVLFPVVKESGDILESGIRSLSSETFPTKRIIVIFAVEERAPKEVKHDALALTEKYKNSFGDVMAIVHPDNLSGEARVKGANVTFAARQAAEYFKARNIPFENIIVSCFDADTVVSPQYFACLTYKFMVTPHREMASYQPIPVYHNNIWEVPAFARVVETGSSFFQLVESTNPEKLVTFSSHSMSFKALVDVGYWPIDMISDDSAIFWKSYIHYNGKYRVIPLYVTVSMDVVSAKTWWLTVKSVYKQKRRWAWGVENFPIVMRGFLENKKIPFYDKLRLSWKLFEGHVSWATWGFILSIIGWIPVLIAGREYAFSVVYYNAPYLMGAIFNLASLSLAISIILSVALLPKQTTRHSLKRKIGFALQWLMVPFILVFLSAMPSLDAQTRLMLGRHMEFWVTDKLRKKQK